MGVIIHFSHGRTGMFTIGQLLQCRETSFVMRFIDPFSQPTSIKHLSQAAHGVG